VASDRILITGCRGQLGRDLTQHLNPEYDVVGVDIDDFDITDHKAVNDALAHYRPKIVLHTAAYTDVDGCENNRVTAMGVNGEGTANIAMACKKLQARLIYYSTDYVFDGTSHRPYVEETTPNPRTVYGQSKLAGEKAVAATCENHLIIRIAWLYSRYGGNFVKTMLRLGKEQQAGDRGTLKVVDDQSGNPTWSLEIARQTEALLESEITGIVHATAEGITTWYGFAKEILRLADMSVDIVPCTTAEYPRPAPRPKNSALINRRLKQHHIMSMKAWDDALTEFMDRYGRALLDEV
jgi:dTDP-4-dehydrorhamnose reductase